MPSDGFTDMSIEMCLSSCRILRTDRNVCHDLNKIQTPRLSLAGQAQTQPNISANRTASLQCLPRVLPCSCVPRIAKLNSIVVQAPKRRSERRPHWFQSEEQLKQHH